MSCILICLSTELNIMTLHKIEGRAGDSVVAALIERAREKGSVTEEPSEGEEDVKNIMASAYIGLCFRDHNVHQGLTRTSTAASDTVRCSFLLSFSYDMDVTIIEDNRSCTSISTGHVTEPRYSKESPGRARSCCRSGQVAKL